MSMVVEESCRKAARFQEELLRVVSVEFCETVDKYSAGDLSKGSNLILKDTKLAAG